MVAAISRILVDPAGAWSALAAPPREDETLLRYVLPLAALGPVCALVGGAAFHRGSFVMLAAGTFVGIVCEVIGVAAIAAALGQLAGLLGGERSYARALSLAAYASTPRWLAGILLLFTPSLGIVAGLAGLYGFWILERSVVPMIGVPQPLAGRFALAAIVVLVLGWFGVALLVRVLGAFANGAPL
ncbi:MAG: YIP1 family protein [Vulcanimicrobiaceae bacterium]